MKQVFWGGSPYFSQFLPTTKNTSHRCARERQEELGENAALDFLIQVPPSGSVALPSLSVFFSRPLLLK